MSDITSKAVPVTVIHGEKISLLRVLGPAHVWALGVGIVLVGEFMGWNYGVGKGGALGALIAAWVIGLLYPCVAMIDSEVPSTVAAAGGQYAQAKHTIGPLMAFNVGLYLVLAYTMLEAGDIQVAGQLLQIGAADMAPYFKAGWAMNLKPELDKDWGKNFTPGLVSFNEFLDGNPTGVEDVFTKLENARRHSGGGCGQLKRVSRQSARDDACREATSHRHTSSRALGGLAS